MKQKREGLATERRPASSGRVPDAQPTMDVRAAVSRVKVTQAMEEAGLEVLLESGRLWGDRLLAGDRILVRKVFCTMVSQLRAPPEPGQQAIESDTQEN
jgi:hypothetical protein